MGSTGKIHSMTNAKATPAPISHYENFPVASWLCPPHLRDAVVALYHFARTADDLADEGDATAVQRLSDLIDYRQDLLSVCHIPAGAISGRWPHVFVPLRDSIRHHALPIPLLHDLLDAFKQDVEKTASRACYSSQTELLDYCRRSANPVGRLLLHLYGVTTPPALELSDAICTSLQLINFWQDLSRDIPRGRFYLPTEEIELHGVQQADLLTLRQTPSATLLIAACALAARASMLKGAALVHMLPGRAGWELRLVVQGGLRILDKIEAMKFATLERRPILHWWDYPVMLWRALWM